jgi:hypothetical protein
VSIHTKFSCVPTKAVLQFVVVLIGIRIIHTVSLIQILVVLLLLIVTIVFIVIVTDIPKVRVTMGLLALYHQLYINPTLHNIVKIMGQINNLISILLIILFGLPFLEYSSITIRFNSSSKALLVSLARSALTIL